MGKSGHFVKTKKKKKKKKGHLLGRKDLGFLIFSLGFCVS